MRATLLTALVLSGSVLPADELAQQSSTDTRPGIAPDIREDESGLKVQRGNFVVVPIPVSNPTLDTGLVAAAAYFYAQSDEQKQKQPASVTAAAGMVTNNDSKAFGLAQQNYWRNDRWRFTGVVGAADLWLSLLAADGSDDGTSVDWRIEGAFLFAKLSRRFSGDWYGGLFTRLIDANQSISLAMDDGSADLDIGDATAAGLGLVVEYDSRDMPINSYSGRHFKLDALFNDESIGSDQTYQSYSAAFQSYHRLTDTVVLAWDLQGCLRGDGAPLWDACTVKLRGFSATDYLGRSSASAQIEARLQLGKRWGLVGFAGSGFAGDLFSDIREHESIPSYGVGLRFSVLAAKRVNMRLDFARSLDSDAIHFTVGEAF